MTRYMFLTLFVFLLANISSAYTILGNEVMVGWNPPEAGYEVGRDCDYFENGVIRSWVVREKNKADFSQSFIKCKNMNSDGVLTGSVETEFHFDEVGGGELKRSFIPLNKLPVGIQVRYKLPATFIEKLVDYRLLYQAPSRIIKSSTAYDKGPWATGRTTVSNYSYIRKCPPKMVLTGLNVVTKGFGGKKEIRGIRIRCNELSSKN